MKGNYLMSLSMASIMIFTLFMPFSYGFNTPSVSYVQEAPQTVDLLNIKSKATGSGCDSIVQTVELDWAEYEALIKAANGTIAGFGSAATQAVQDQYTASESSTDASVNSAKNQFVMTDSGPMYIFNVLQFSASNPADSCQLTNIVTKGYISYVSNLDQNLRFCSQYPSAISCENGRITTEGYAKLASVQENAQKIAALQTLVESSSLDWAQVRTAVNDMGFADSALKSSVISEIDAGNFDKAKTQIAKLINASVQDVSMVSATPWNYVESNATTLGLTSADQTMMFPNNLAQFIKKLKDQSGTDTFIATLDLISTASNVVSIGRLVSASKFMTKAGKIDPTKYDDLAKSGGAKTLVSRQITNTESRMAQLEKKYGKAAAEQMDEYKNLAAKKKGLSDLSDEMAKANTGEEMKAVMAKAYGGTELKGDEFIQRSFTKQYLPSTDEAERTVIAEGLPVFQTYKGNPTGYAKLLESTGSNAAQKAEYDKLMKFLKQETQADGVKNAESAMADFSKDSKTVIGGMKGEDLFVNANLNQQFYNLPENGLFGKGELMNNYGMAKGLTIGGKILGTGQLFAYRWLANSKKLFTLAQDFAHVTFYLKALDSQPTAVIEVSTPIYTLKPASTIKGSDKGIDESYLELVKVVNRATNTGDYDFYPSSFVDNLMNYFGFDYKEIIGEADYSPVMRKFKSIGDYITIIDQETKADILTQESMPVNLISSRAFSDKTRWYFNSFNKDNTQYYGFENPDAYYKANGNYKYTTMALLAWNIDISAITTTVEQDWATYGSISTLLQKSMPSTLSLFGTSFFAGFWGPTGLLKNQVVRYGTQIGLARLIGGQLTDLGKSEYNNWVGHGSLVDMKEAYGNSSEMCSIVKPKAEERVQKSGETKAIISGINTALSLAEASGAIAGPWAPILLVAQLAVSVGDYWATQDYMNAKDAGLAAMKSCYETEFEILSWQKIDTQATTSANITSDFLSQGTTGVSSAIGTALSALSPEVKSAISNIGDNYYWSTMSLSGVVEGQSRVNLYPSKVYQVHFDKDATIKWFANQQCGIDLCSQNSNGEYKCMTKQGYFLLDSEGKVIFEGPQVAFLDWSNLETYASIPQKVINIRQDASKFMNVYSSGINITNACILDEISNLTKTPASDAGVKGEFGNLEVIETGDESIWFDGTDVVVSFFKEKALGGNVYGASQTARFAGAHLEIGRDGSVSVISASGTDLLGEALPMGTDGVISFDNAMLVPGKQDSTSRNGQNYTIKSAYNAMDGAKVLHLFIKDLLVFQSTDFEDLGITGSCGNGTINGIKITGTLSTDDNDQLRQLLEEMCLSDFTNGDNSTITIRDGMLCKRDTGGKETCTAITSVDGSGIKLADGSTYDLGVDSNGVPWWYYTDPSGVKSQIPLMWMNGLGGSMYYNGQTGQISIKNEFPFSIASSYNQYGALAGSGLSLPGTPEYGGRTGTSSESGNITPVNLLASLPGVPEQPVYFLAFILVLFSALIAVRVRNYEEE